MVGPENFVLLVVDLHGWNRMYTALTPSKDAVEQVHAKWLARIHASSCEFGK